MIFVFAQKRLCGGQTLRYHTVPQVGNGQTVAEHSWRAAVLLHTLWPDKFSLNALLHTLYHDAAEQTLGDIPAPAKWRYPVMYEHYENAEYEVMQDLEACLDLTPEERAMCSIVDMLECVDHVGHRIIRGDHSLEALTVYWNGRRNLYRRFTDDSLFGPVHSFLDSLHTQVCAAYPAAANTTD